MKKIIERTGMTAPQGMVIGLLHKNKKMKVTELSKQLHLPNSTVSGIIDKLEEQDAVIRERSEDDDLHFQRLRSRDSSEEIEQMR